MARGITEKDVFTACDALVLAGERPTIERVRQKIGRGSPNTVSPMLDAWFKGLGRRLQDPGAFAAPSDVPEPVLQAAQHFWEVAQTTARADVQAQVQERLQPMRAEVQAADHAVTVAHAERDAQIRQSASTRQELADVSAALEDERVAHASAKAHVSATQERVTALNARLADLEEKLLVAEERARAGVQAAHERAAGAERRAAMEIENERSARGRADKRAEALEKRVESLQASLASQAEELVAARTAQEHQGRDIARLQAQLDGAEKQQQACDAALNEAKLAIARAETEARTTQVAMQRMLPMLGKSKAKRGAPNSRAGSKA